MNKNIFFNLTCEECGTSFVGLFTNINIRIKKTGKNRFTKMHNLKLCAACFDKAKEIPGATVHQHRKGPAPKKKYWVIRD